MNQTRKIMFRLAADSALLVGATTGSRLILVLSLVALGPFISGSEMAAYDLFVVVSAYLMIVLTLGLDSGLSITANARNPKRQTAYIWFALAALLAMAVLAAVPAWAMVRYWLSTNLLNNEFFLLAFVHAAINGATLLIFSFYRWTGKATLAALFVIAGSLSGVALAFMAFFTVGTIAAFIAGLIAGNAAGLFASLVYLFRDRGLTTGFSRASRVTPLFRRIMKMSLPFMANSVLLLSRRSVDRGLLIAFNSVALLGPYAYVSRVAEVVAFVFAIPASGMAPAFVRNHAEERYRRLARIAYLTYLSLSLLVTAACFYVQLSWSQIILPVDARPAAIVLTAMVAGNLFFGEVFIAGFGYVIKERGRAVVANTVFFIATYLLLAGTAAYLGYGLSGIACGFVIAAWLYATVYVHFAERLVSFDYPMLAVHLLRLATLAIALLSLTRLGMPV